METLETVRSTLDLYVVSMSRTAHDFYRYCEAGNMSNAITAEDLLKMSKQRVRHAHRQTLSGGHIRRHKRVISTVKPHSRKVKPCAMSGKTEHSLTIYARLSFNARVKRRDSDFKSLRSEVYYAARRVELRNGRAGRSGEKMLKKSHVCICL